MVTTNININQSVELTVDIERILVSAINIKDRIKNIGLGLGIIIITLILLACFIVLFPFAIIINNILFPLLARKINKIRKEAIQQIPLFEYKEVKELQFYLKILLELTDKLLKHKLSRLFVFFFFIKALQSIKIDAIAIQEICADQFVFHKKDMKMTEQEFKEYQEALSVFADVWDYETSEEEEQQIFEHKKKIA